MVGEFIAADRDHFVVATKYTLGVMANNDVSQTGNSRKNMMRSVEASFRCCSVRIVCSIYSKTVYSVVSMRFWRVSITPQNWKLFDTLPRFRILR